MTAFEKFADEIGQITFRLETNFRTFLNTQNELTKDACEEDIQADIEKLKDLKQRLTNFDNSASV